MSEGNNINHVAKKARHSDHVLLNVGGTKFSTSITTLTSSSAYFQSLFSEEWANNRPNSPDDEVFVDQDPVPFQVLLSFMRLGKVQASDFTLPVLLQAKFFGMERLLAAVRGVARRSGDDCPLTMAARDAEIVCNSEGKEIARIWLQSRELYFDDQEGLRLWEGGEIVVTIELNNRSTSKRYHMSTTFIDALNWLHKNGLEEQFPDSDYHLLGGLYFSKLPPDNETTRSLASGGLFGSDMKTRENKEFAACIAIPDFEGSTKSWIEADVGKDKDKSRRKCRNSLNPVTSKVSRIEKLVENDTRDFEPNDVPIWLQRNKFFEREHDLEKTYLEALRIRDYSGREENSVSSPFGRAKSKSEKHVDDRVFWSLTISNIF